ncbi:DUF21 domain-containing protein [Methanotrichaceae archaeon M04Ac]|uniref:DUF21 domain-containing protein n=1 Tax=Candidatus Methanocrinis alkalitolerans TaxID=3033395 RepID=A0ABT5XFA9_9EURY|nr:DUF21 domain-containing protein [Candidatus Methanocrinis alkalitolerans]MCR3884031.1 DUF21 domain-containing protein [Methanothrix sp.]MDF0593357.1 DUF21 domain-containing protein [Candidatus Methanocrinis alkalitolerans]
MDDLFIWMGIAVCISQSAVFSGLNLAFFTVSKMELQIEVAKNNRNAIRILALREDSNFLLATILWGNVAVNTLLALLSGSVLAGVLAFFFSTVIITIFGEIIPQAYFSRRALWIAAFLSPLLRFYQVLLYPAAKPTGLLLDRWVGPEAITFYRERDIRELIKLHMQSSMTEIEKVEGQGALNFLSLDDVPLADEGEPIDPGSIVELSFSGNRPVFPVIEPDASDEFLRKINFSGRKWIVIVDPEGEPRLVMDSDEFIRDIFLNFDRFNPHLHCHRPIIERRADAKIGDIISRLRVSPHHLQDDVIDDDVILLWAEEEKRVITGADILGRLLRGIVRNPKTDAP